MDKVKVGDRIKIIHMKGEPHYKDRDGVVTQVISEYPLFWKLS